MKSVVTSQQGIAGTLTTQQLLKVARICPVQFNGTTTVNK